MKMSEHVLVIGASGGIGQELVEQLTSDEEVSTVHCVSRSEINAKSQKQKTYTFDSSDESSVDNFIRQIVEQGVKFSRVICTTGVLHTSGSKQLKPEKRLEDLSSEQLIEYFRINTIVPALWLKNLVKVLDKERASIVFFSARVGSISENGLGGWYGYRSSKAALNMMVKTASVEYKRRSPNTVLACYHPGTVDTKLSKPFQSNVKPNKLFTPQFTVSQLLSHIKAFDSEQSPYYIDWEGKTINY